MISNDDECDCYATLEDVIDFITDCDGEDIEQILSAIHGLQTVEDLLKRKLIDEALKKYSLTQLEEKLK